MTAAAPSLPTMLNTVRAHGLRVSTARRLVLEALMDAGEPRTAEQLAGDADLASTYRNLETLETIGLVRHVHLGHGPGRYELDRPQQRLGDLRELRPLDAAALAGAAGDPSRGARERRLRGRVHALPDRRALRGVLAHCKLSRRVNDRGLRDAVRHVGAALPHGRTLPEGQWQARHRALRWLLWAHVAAIAGRSRSSTTRASAQARWTARRSACSRSSRSSGSAAGARSRWRSRSGC